MMQSSKRPTDMCSNQLLSIPIDGRWIWDEMRKELVYESRYQMNKNKKLISNNQLLKIDLRFGSIHYRKQNRPLQHIVKTKDDNKITLVDIIQASLNVMSEIFYIPIEFEEYVSMPQVNDFLLCLLNYFYWYFEITDEVSLENEQYIDRSKREKERIHMAYANLLISLQDLSCKYSVLLLGIDLKDFHHMRNGDLFYSCTYLDRTIYESLIIFSTYFTWITFYRQNFDLIRNELARLFRTEGNIEMLRIPTKQTLEDRIKDNPLSNSIDRYKLIDCTEIFAEKTAMLRTTDIEQTKSMIWNNNNKIFNQSIKESRPATRLNSFLTRDIDKQEKQEENVELYTLQFDRKSPQYRQRLQSLVSQRKNRIHGILTKQLKISNEHLLAQQYYHLKNKKKNEKLTVEQVKNKLRERENLKREHLIKQEILNCSMHGNMSILPAPPNPLEKTDRMQQDQSIFSKVEYKSKKNIGIIGKSYSGFDLIRLTLKQNIEKNNNIPEEFLVTLPNEIKAILLQDLNETY